MGILFNKRQIEFLQNQYSMKHRLKRTGEIAPELKNILLGIYWVRIRKPRIVPFSKKVGQGKHWNVM